MFIKAEYKGQKRKFKLQDKSGFAELLKELIRCFGSDINQLELGYIDEDEEFIRITNDEEWEVCVEEFGIKNKSKQVNSLEIKIREPNSSFMTTNASATQLTQSFACLDEAKPAQVEDELKESLDQWNMIGESIKPEEVAAPEPELGHSVSNIEPDLAQSEMSCPEGFTLRGETPIIDEIAEEEKMQEEELPKIPKYTNLSDQDIVLDMKITGTPEELAQLQHSITHRFAPMAGFSIDKAEIEFKQEAPEQSLLNSSSMTQDLRDEIESMIEEKIARAMKKSVEPEKPKSTYNHFGITCDVCRKIITNSCRFKSLVKHDFDICETCEATGVHPEPLIKIRAPLVGNISWNVNRHFNEMKAIFEGKKVEIKQESKDQSASSHCGFKSRMCQLTHIRPAQSPVEAKVTVADKFAEMGKMIPNMTYEKPQPQVAPSRPLAHIRPCKPAEPALPVVDLSKESEDFKTNFNRIIGVFPRQDKQELFAFMKKHEEATLEELICKLLDQMPCY